MLSYCLKCRKKTPKVVKKKKTMLLSKSVACGRKKLRFTKVQETGGLLRMISKIPKIVPLLI